MISNNIKISEPVIEGDFREAIKLVEDNIVLEKNFDINYIKSLSSGEILVSHRLNYYTLSQV